MSEDVTINSIMTLILNYSVYVATSIMKHMFPYSGSKSTYTLTVFKGKEIHINPKFKHEIRFWFGRQGKV